MPARGGWARAAEICLKFSPSTSSIESQRKTFLGVVVMRQTFGW
jgi:hypothetical protein